jgi:hypothetical protein
MSPEVIENAISRERTPESIVRLDLNDAHICGTVGCNTISNCADVCPGCTSQTTTVATLINHPINALAHKIAEDSAKCDLEHFCSWLQPDNGLLPTRWYNTSLKVHEAEREVIDRAVQYLAAIGVLIRHAQNPSLVRWEGCGENAA